jgi:hypothetical protein
VRKKLHFIIFYLFVDRFIKLLYSYRSPIMKQPSTTTQAMLMTFAMVPEIYFNSQSCKLLACCFAFVKLSATGSGSAGLDVFGLPEAFIESFSLLPDDAEIFHAWHSSGPIII